MGRRLCHRYGPGRLPYASRRDIGGGLAMAATGLLAAVLWFGGTWTLLLAGLESDMLGFLLVGGMFAFPVAIVSAFLLGTLCWRTASSETRRPLRGAIFGGVTATGSLIAGRSALPSFSPSRTLPAARWPHSRRSSSDSSCFLPASFSRRWLPGGWFSRSVSSAVGITSAHTREREMRLRATGRQCSWLTPRATDRRSCCAGPRSCPRRFR